MESMEFIRSGRLLRFLNHADMGTVIPDTGIIGGFAESDLPIVGDNQPVSFSLVFDFIKVSFFWKIDLYLLFIVFCIFLFM